MVKKFLFLFKKNRFFNVSVNKNLIWANCEQSIYFNREIYKVVKKKLRYKKIKIERLGCMFIFKVLKICKYIFIFDSNCCQYII